MIRSTFKQFFKLLRQNRFFTFLNLFGISITIMIIMMMDIQLENKIWPKGSEDNRNMMAQFKGVRIDGEEWMRSGGFTSTLIENHIKNINVPNTLAISSSNIGTYFGENKTTDYFIRYTNAGFWKVFNFNFIEGRPFNSEEVESSSKVAIISNRFKDFYFKEENAIGETIEFEGQPFVVIGVVEYVSLLCNNSFSDIWVPYTFEQEFTTEIDQTGAFDVTMLIENKNDIYKLKKEIEEIESKVSNIIEDGTLSIAGPYDPVENFFSDRNDKDTSTKSSYYTQLILKWLLILLIPAINLISINISRISERASEIGVRIAFGATKKSIIKKSITENTILTMIGALLGFALAIIGIELFKEKIFADVFSGELINVNYTINTMSFIICLIAALVLSILSGLIPAFKTANQQPAIALKGGKL